MSQIGECHSINIFRNDSNRKCFERQKSLYGSIHQYIINTVLCVGIKTAFNDMDEERGIQKNKLLSSRRTKDVSVAPFD